MGTHDSEGVTAAAASSPGAEQGLLPGRPGAGAGSPCVSRRAVTPLRRVTRGRAPGAQASPVPVKPVLSAVLN